MADKERQDRDRLNIDVQNTPLTNEKLTGEQLLDLTQYCIKYGPFTNDLQATETKILTIKQFCLHLAQEMNYHRELDKIESS